MNPLEGMTIIIQQEEPFTAKTNRENRANVIENWKFGPEETTSDNTDYYRMMARAWSVKPEQARRQMCGNCVHFNNSPEKLEMLEVVPEDDYDADGGGRGYCMKFEFVCHNLRVCQAWESKEEHEEY